MEEGYEIIQDGVEILAPPVSKEAAREILKGGREKHQREASYQDLEKIILESGDFIRMATRVTEENKP